jgi:hypothetical protein
VFGSQFTVAATGGSSGNPVTFSSGGGCSNSAGTFTMTSGTTACQVKYDQAGSANYNAAPEVTESVTATKANQAISVTTHAPSGAVFNSQFTVAATGGGSGNPVTFSSGGGCSNSAGTFTMTSGTTACQVEYDQAGDANYNAAPEVTESVGAQKADQTITVTTQAPTTAVYATSFTVAASAGGGLVTFSSSGVCINFGDAFTMMSGTGTCTVEYDQVGNANYNAAPEITETVSAVKADQTITVTTHAPANEGDGSSFDVAANAPGGAVSYASGGSCSNSGATFTMTSGTGTCTVKYDQAGDGDYNAAPEVTETVNAGKVDQSISVTTHAPSGAAYGSQFTVAASAPGGAVAYASGGSCSNSGATFTITSAGGTCTIEYDQAGNGDYNAAPEVSETVNAVAAFGGFQTPLSNAVLKTGAKFTVKFTLTDASGHPLSAATAAAVGSVEVTLTGPNGNTAQLASAPCIWVTQGQLFQCTVKTPAGLKTGTTNAYSLTALQNVGGHYVPASPYTNTASDANPETIFFGLSKIAVSARVGKRTSQHGRFLRAQVSLAGRMSPATAGERLHFIVQRFEHGAWRTLARASRRLDRHDTAKVSLRASRTGRYRAQASFAGDRSHAPMRSAWTSFHVR